MKIVRKIILIDDEKCDGCGNCINGCAEGALALVDGKAKVISDNLCDGLGACIGECPQDALKIIEREVLILLSLHMEMKFFSHLLYRAPKQKELSMELKHLNL